MPDTKNSTKTAQDELAEQAAAAKEAERRKNLKQRYDVLKNKSKDTDRDETLKEAAEAEKRRIIQEQQQLKERNKKIAQEKYIADTTYKSGKHEKKTYWQVVQEHADQLIEDGADGYSDWSATMSRLIKVLTELNKAMYHAAPLRTMFETAWDQTGAKFFANRNEKLILDQPNVLECSVHVDDNGQLTSTATIDSKPISDDEKMHFDAGLCAWLKYKGCALEADPLDPDNTSKGIVKDANGKRLTTAEFNTLCRDPDTGLQKFMEGRFDVGVLVNKSSPDGP